MTRRRRAVWLWLTALCIGSALAAVGFLLRAHTWRALGIVALALVEESSGAVADGKRRLIFWSIGESGMSGRGARGGLPGGYPPADRSLWLMGDDYLWKPLREPTDAPVAPVDRELAEAVPAGVGPAGLFAWLVQRELGADREVGLVQCAKGGSTSNDWAERLYRPAVSRLRHALRTARTELGGVLIYQGINDAMQSRPAWRSGWSRVLERVRAEFGPVPVMLVVNPRTIPTDRAYPGWAYVAKEQAALDGVLHVASPEGPFDRDRLHLETAGAIELAQRMFARWSARIPGAAAARGP